MSAAMTPQSPPLRARAEDPDGVESDVLVVGWAVNPGRLEAHMHGRGGTAVDAPAAVAPVVVELGDWSEPRVHRGPLKYVTPPAVRVGYGG